MHNTPYTVLVSNLKGSFVSLLLIVITIWICRCCFWRWWWRVTYLLLIPDAIWRGNIILWYMECEFIWNTNSVLLLDHNSYQLNNYMINVKISAVYPSSYIQKNFELNVFNVLWIYILFLIFNCSGKLHITVSGLRLYVAKSIISVN